MKHVIPMRPVGATLALLLGWAGCADEQTQPVAMESVSFFGQDGKQFLAVPGSNPLDLTAFENDDDRVPLILEVEDGWKDEVAGRHNGRKAKHLPFVFVETRRGDLQRLDRRGVKRVHPNSKIEFCRLDQSVPVIKDLAGWSAVETAYGRTLDGTGVRIAVLDSGIDTAHPDFAGRIVATRNFGTTPDIEDTNGHGTHCASIAAGSGAASGGRYKGVAPGASLMIGKLVGPYATTSDPGILAMEWAVDNGAHVISISWGIGTTDGTDPLSITANWASDRGVLVVVAAGNSGVSTSVMSPAVAAKALAVGASAKDDTLAGFSSRGPTPDWRMKPDVLAPGVGIVAGRASRSAWTAIADSSYYAAASGTSMAAPHMAGFAALLKQAHPTWTPRQLKNAIQMSSRDLGYRAWEQGMGRADAVKAVGVDVELSGQGEINFGMLMNGASAASSFTVESGTASFSESDPNLSLSAGSATAGTTVNVALSLPADLAGLRDVPITVTTARGSYRLVAMYYRAPGGRIVARVVSSNPALRPIQTAKFFFRDGPTPVTGPFYDNRDEMVAVVGPGTYRIIALHHTLAKSSTSDPLEVAPFVLTSAPITISTNDQAVAYDFNLDTAYSIPVDLSGVGYASALRSVGIGIKTLNGLYADDSGFNISQNVTRVLVNDTVQGDWIVPETTLADDATYPTRAHLLNWQIKDVTAANHPAVLRPGVLQRHSLSLRSADAGGSRSLVLAQRHVASAQPSRLQFTPGTWTSRTVDLYFQRNAMAPWGNIEPLVEWSNSQGGYYAIGLPHPGDATQPILMGSSDPTDLTAPPAISSVTINGTPVPAAWTSSNIPTVVSPNPLLLDWPDVTDPSGVTYHVAIYRYAQYWLELSEGAMFMTSSSHTSVPLANGTHIAGIRAVDGKGNTSAFYSVLFFVWDTTSPVCSITSPAGGATLSGSVSVDVDASDDANIVRVELYRDGTLAGTDTTAPYRFSWDTSTVLNGSHSLVAKAYDAAGHVGTSSTVNIAVNNGGDTAAPTISISSPVSGTMVSGVVPVVFSYSDNVGVTKIDVYVDGGFRLTMAPGTALVWNTVNYADGIHSMMMKAYDAAGNVGTSNTIAPRFDNTGPAISILSPSNGATVKGKVTITVNASDPSGVSKVEFYVNGVFMYSDGVAPWSWTWNAGGARGTSTITAKGYDTLGNVRSTSITVVK